MSFNIVDTVKDQISEQLLGKIGGALQMQESQTTGALAGALPGLLSGLMNSSNNPAGASAMLEAVQKQEDGVLGNLGNLLGNNQSSEVVNQGNSQLTSLLGEGALGQLAGVIANFSGISRNNSSSLLGMLAPIVIGVIKSQLMAGAIDKNALTSLFNDQKDNINAAMPQGFSEQLNSAGFFDSIATNPATAPTPAAPPSPQPAPAPATNGGLKKWLLPAVAVLAVAYFGKQYMGDKSESVDPNVSAAATSVNNSVASISEQASQQGAQIASQLGNISDETLQAAQAAMPKGQDFSNISEGLQNIFSSTNGALAGITDIASAKAAVPTLEDVSSQLSGFNNVLARMPEAVKQPVSAIVTSGYDTIQPVIERVTAIPGVGAVIQPVIAPMVEMLQGLAHD